LKDLKKISRIADDFSVADFCSATDVAVKYPELILLEEIENNIGATPSGV
jgi:hypothetical protein